MTNTAPIETASCLNKWVEQPVRYLTRDLIVYAMGIGATDLRYTYEFHDDFAAFPTYPLILSFKGTEQEIVSFPSEAMRAGPKGPSLPGVKVMLDGERYVEKIRPIPEDGGEFTLKQRIIGVHARGSGASVETESLLVDSDGNILYRMVSGGFYVGAKNFKDSGVTNSEKVPVPSRKPDAIWETYIPETQAQLYRLSGDYNPLHIDPEIAQSSGFKARNDADQFKAIKCRFASPVVPGDTLVVEMWRDGSRIVFVSKVKATGKPVVNNAYVDLNKGSNFAWHNPYKFDIRDISNKGVHTMEAMLAPPKE